MRKKKIEKVFFINPDAAPRGFRNRVTRGLVERAVGFPKLDKIIHAAREELSSGRAETFCDSVLRAMNVKLEVSDEDLARIPKTGPVVLVSNHPFGGIEGVAFIRMLERIRPDYKVMANYFLDAIPEMRGMFIFVNPFGGQNALRQNIKPIQESIRHLKEGHILGVFPSGEVSSVDLKSRLVRDPPWNPMIASLARKTGATIVPMHFCGRNPGFFQFAGLVHPRLRTVLLPRMTVRRRNHEMQAFVGAPITPAECAKFATDAELIQYARLRSYALEGRVEPKKRTLFPRLRRRRPKAAPPETPIVPETPLAEIEAALAALPKEAFLMSGSGLDVYFTKLAADSPILREIGRLREITFRAVGEGTGQASDTDRYDLTYHHLFLWDPAERRIAGAYRMGLAPEIMASEGVKGLYTHTLFKYSAELIEKCQPAIEMGRSFVRPEYQRGFGPLLMLWKGIGAFIARHPEYVNLFGPVSISAAYKDASRNILLRSLSLSNFARELARLVRPRRPARRTKRAEWKNPDYAPFIADTNRAGAILADIEKDHKGIPILVKQYLKLGGRILAFNVDPDFGDCIDGLILVDLRKTDRRTRAHYMGEESDAAFRAFHHLD
ncbi:MAG: lysophospholipid acyltransferase family protein [Kiritimatiellae bacterium]|nr:lysophospholipid acyltransferase family protein [Kiritimatiellia bacterium]